MELTIKEAAARMGKSQQFLRIALQQGRCPFGFAAKTTENSWSYYLSRKKFREWEEDGKEKRNDHND